MTKIDVYNVQGEKSGQMELNDSVFRVAFGSPLVHQVYQTLESNTREPWAHVKTKDEVRGGGKKPWKQKGTGRARHGSSRSPIWSGGGVTFGPRNDRNYTQKVTKSMNRQAVRMCLSAKVAEGALVVLEAFATDGKTKTMATLRAKLPGVKKTTLVLSHGVNEEASRTVRNLKRVDMQQAVDVNVADLMHHQFVIATKDAVTALEARLAKK